MEVTPNLPVTGRLLILIAGILFLVVQIDQPKAWAVYSSTLS